MRGRHTAHEMQLQQAVVGVVGVARGGVLEVGDVAEVE